jgi:flagellar motor switch protein FliM
MAVSQSDKHSDVPEAEQPDADAVISTSEAAAGPPKLDFSQPTKFTTEIRRRIATALHPFCETLAAGLESELKADVKLVVADVGQRTWAAAKAQLAPDAIAVAVETDSPARQMLLNVELPLVLQALECLLGGEPGAQAPAARRLTEIDWALTRGLLDAIVHELSAAWGELGGSELRRGEVDLEGDAGVTAPNGEATLVLTLDCAIGAQRSTIALLMPWAAIEPVAESIRASAGQSQGVEQHGGDALRRGLAGAQVLLRAEVGSAQMPIERMLELAPGSLVALHERAEHGVRLFAEGVSLGRGRPGRSGKRRAIKLESTGEPAERAHTYAKLGRAELERARAHAHSAGSDPGGAPQSGDGRAILRSIFVRVWAELGRTHLPLGRALELAPGAVVELDQSVEAPVELFANGLCVANGSLVVTGDGGWGVQVQALV